MKLSKVSLDAALLFGTAILDGSIYQDETKLNDLYNLFSGKKNKKDKEERKEFVEYMSLFLNPHQLSQLASHMLEFDGKKLTSRILREDCTLGYHFFIRDVAINYNTEALISALRDKQYERVLAMITLPEVACKHYKNYIIPALDRSTDAEMQACLQNKRADTIINHVFFNVFKATVLEYLNKKTPNDATSLAEMQRLIGEFDQLLTIPAVMVKSPDQKFLVRSTIPTSHPCLPALMAARERVYSEIERYVLPAAVIPSVTPQLGFNHFVILTSKLMSACTKLSPNQFDKLVEDNFDRLMQIKDIDELKAYFDKLIPATPVNAGTSIQTAIDALLAQIRNFNIHTLWSDRNQATTPQQLVISGPSGFRKAQGASDLPSSALVLRKPAAATTVAAIPAAAIADENLEIIAPSGFRKVQGASDLPPSALILRKPAAATTVAAVPAAASVVENIESTPYNFRESSPKGLPEGFTAEGIIKYFNAVIFGIIEKLNQSVDSAKAARIVYGVQEFLALSKFVANLRNSNTIATYHRTPADQIMAVLHSAIETTKKLLTTFQTKISEDESTSSHFKNAIEEVQVSINLFLQLCKPLIVDTNKDDVKLPSPRARV